MHQADTPSSNAQGSKRGTIAKWIITFYLDQDTSVDKRKIIQCSSRVVAYPAIPFPSISVLKTSLPQVNSASPYL